MNKRIKLLKKLLAGRSLSFNDVDTLLQSSGFELDVAGSHHIYRHPSKGRVVVPRHGKDIKAVYLKQIAEALSHDLSSPE
jgi:predicted RNA binding protein YcfA (HicA-like mRNA interferase family)